MKSKATATLLKLEPGSRTQTVRKALIDAGNRARNEGYDRAIIILSKSDDTGMAFHAAGLDYEQQLGVASLFMHRRMVSTD